MSSARRLLTPLLLALFPLVLPCSMAQKRTSAHETLQRRFDEKDRKLEQLFAEYWRAEYRMQQGDTCASSRPAQEKIRALITEPDFIAELKAARFADRIWERRRVLFLDEAMESRIFATPELVQLVEKIRREQSAKRYRVRDRLLTRADVNNVIGHDPDRERRREAWLATGELTARTGELIRRAMKMRNALALKHGAGSFTDFMLRRRGITRPRLLELFEQLRTRTEVDYDRLLQRIREKLGVERLEPWDLEYYFAVISGDYEKKLIPEQMWGKIRKLAAALGYGFDDPRVDVKITDITFGGYTFPILYGKEVRILVNRHTGIRFADTLLHEAGHALHYSYNREEPSFVLRANYPAPVDEGIGQIMAVMLYRPEIATRIFDLSAKEAEAISERYRQKSLYEMRALIAEEIFEIEAYKNPDQDLAALYARVQSDHLGVEFHGGATWAYNPFYASIPMYQQNYVLAEMVARQVHAFVDSKFGAPWDKRAGTYLRQKLLSRGGLLSLDEIMQEATGEPLTAKHLIAALAGRN